MTRLILLALVLCLVACSDDTTPLEEIGSHPPDAGQGDEASPPPPDGPHSEENPGPDGATDTAAPPDTPLTPDSSPDVATPIDLGPGGCLSNADCLPILQFCSLPLGCTPPGVCMTVPLNCTFIFDPVCGCDDKDHSNACFANSAGTSVKHKGKCP